MRACRGMMSKLACARRLARHDSAEHLEVRASSVMPLRPPGIGTEFGQCVI